MTNTCPNCGELSSLGNKVCRCGLPSDHTRNDAMEIPQDSGDRVLNQPSDSFQGLRTARLILGLIVGLLLGVILLIWELLGSTVTMWGVVHPILLIVCFGGLLIAGKKGGYF